MRNSCLMSSKGQGSRLKAQGLKLLVTRYLSLVTFLLLTAYCLLPTSAWSEEQVSKKKKKYPHPHTLHLEVVSQKTPDFSIDEIKDWPGFLRLLQSRLSDLPFSIEARMVIKAFKPDALNSDEKTIVVNELNRLLMDETFGPQRKSIAAFSSETKKLESDYIKTKGKEDLKWLNRGIINDLFPQISRKGRGEELKKITCATCHEAVAEGVKEADKAGVDEKSVMECFSKAIAGEKTMEECKQMADLLKRTRIEPYGPLKNFIQRKDAQGEIPFFVAVHPENPYTFKPLLKRLVCVECHGYDRKVSKVRGRNGKVKEIPIFYGLGIKKRHEHDRASAESDEK